MKGLIIQEFSMVLIWLKRLHEIQSFSIFFLLSSFTTTRNEHSRVESIYEGEVGNKSNDETKSMIFMTSSNRRWRYFASHQCSIASFAFLNRPNTNYQQIILLIQKGIMYKSVTFSLHIIGIHHTTKFKYNYTHGKIKSFFALGAFRIPFVFERGCIWIVVTSQTVVSSVHGEDRDQREHIDDKTLRMGFFAAAPLIIFRTWCFG